MKFNVWRWTPKEALLIACNVTKDEFFSRYPKFEACTFYEFEPVLQTA